MTFTNTSTNALGFEWYVNGVLNASTVNFTQSFGTAGVYAVVLKATGVCEATFTRLIIVRSLCSNNSAQFRYPISDGDDFIWPSLTVSNAQGAVFMAGSRGTTQFVAKVLPNGTMPWAVYDLFPAAQSGFKSGLFTTSDNALIYLNFNTNGTGFLVKRDQSGQELWSRQIQISSPGQYGMQYLCPHPNGNISCIFALSTGFQLYHFDPAGNLLWARNLNGNLVEVNNIRAAANGGIWVSGVMKVGIENRALIIRLDASGNFLWSKQYPIPTVFAFGCLLENLPDNGFSLVYRADGTSNDLKSFLIRCDASGNVLWSKRYDVPGLTNPQISKPILMPDGNYLDWTREGLTQGNDFLISYYISKIDPDGNVLWTRHLDLPQSDLDNLMAPIAVGGKLYYFMPNYPDELFRFSTDWNNPEPSTCYLGPASLVASPINVSALNGPLITVTNAGTQVSAYLGGSSPLALVEPALACGDSPPCPEICDNELDDDDDGYVDCFDSDCDCFNGVDCTSLPPADNFDARLAWESPVDELSWTGVPIVANLNPQTDSLPEIIAPVASVNFFTPAHALQIFRGDGANAGSPDQIYFPVGFEWQLTAHPAIADVNSDGVPELLMLDSYGYIRVYRNYIPGANPCMQLWLTSDQPAELMTRPMLADFDQDGTPEVYAGNDVFRFNFTDPANPQLLRVLDGSGPAGQFFGGANAVMAADLLSPADCNGDPDCEGLELAAGSVIYSIDIDLLDGDGYQIKVAKNLNTLAPAFNWEDGFTTVGDIDLDGIPDVVVSAKRSNGSGTQYGVYVWNKNGLVHFFGIPTPSSLFGGLPAVANVYDDTQSGASKDLPEIIVCSNTKLNCLNINAANVTPAQPWWWTLATTDVSGFTGCTVFDFNGDNLQEIVYRDQSDLRIMYGGAAPFPPGVDSQRNWWKTVTGSGTADEFPVVADVDNDGQAEIAVTGLTVEYTSPNQLKARLRVFESNAAPWMPCRKLWNQFNYNPVIVNDDLSIPAQQQKHWLEFPGPGGGKWPFNTFLAQLPLLNKNHQPAYPAADAIADSVQVVCEGNLLKIKVKVCNNGSAELPANTPVAFYKADPTLVNAALLGALQQTDAPVPAGACRYFSFTLPAFDGTIFGAVNDNGLVPRPYSLTTDFPGSNLPECHFPNNLFTLNGTIPGPALDLGADRTSCLSSIEVLHAGGGFEEYKWQNGYTDSVYTAYGPGKYWVQVKDGCDNVQSDTIQVTVAALNGPELGADQTLCIGDSVVLNAGGFTKVTWTPNNAVACADCPEIMVKPAASTTFRVTVQTGDCLATDSVRIYVQPQPLISFSVKNGNCVDSLAQVESFVSSGAAPYSYQWSNAADAPVISGLQSGTYGLIVTDANGCRSIDSVAVQSTVLLQAQMSSTPILCNGQTGAATLEVQNAELPVQYHWSNDAVTPGVNGLLPGIYFVTVTDAIGCTLVDTVQFSAPSALILSLSGVEPACFGTASGSGIALISGGTAPYQFLWTNSDTTQNLNHLAAGNYQLTATDANGCTIVESLNIGEPPLLAFDLVQTAPACQGLSSGSIQVEPSGGTAPYLFKWSNDSLSQNLTGVPAGFYTVTVSDVQGCSDTLEITLDELPALVLTATAIAPGCFGDSTGWIDLNLENGVAPVQFLWSNGATAPSLAGLSAGTFSVVATDALGCTGMLEVVLEAPLALELSQPLVQPVQCHGDTTGVITAAATGGTEPYQFLWSNSSSGPQLTHLPAGTYHLTVSDANGCSLTVSATLTEPPAVLVSPVHLIPACQGQPSGAIDIGVSGGTGTYQFAWSNDSLTQNLANIPAGTYSVTVTDALGCTGTLEVLLEASPEINSAVSIQAPACFGDSNGSVHLNISGGIAPIQYLWSNGAASQDLVGIPAGDYGFTATDANGCTLEVPVQVLQPEMLTATVASGADTCGRKVGFLDIQATGGTPDYQYAWSSGAATSDLNQLGAGIYTLTLTDANGCTAVYSETVPSIGAVPVISVQTSGVACDDEVVIQASGSSGIQFEWLTPAVETVFGDSITARLSGIYKLTATDAAGCVATETIDIDLPALLEAEALPDSATCFGAQDGSVLLNSVSGGTPPYSFSIDGIQFTTVPLFEGLAAGVYSVTVVDAAGCTWTTQVQVGQPDPFAVSLLASASAVTVDETVQLTAQPLPASAILTGIVWQPASLFPFPENPVQIVAPLTGTVFSVTVTNENGCVASDSVFIAVDSPQVFIPNVLKPGSSGNGTLTVYSDNHVESVRSLRVYDRWGGLIFENKNFAPNDTTAGWDGTYGGRFVGPGVFVFVAELVLKSGEIKKLDGSITVIR